jgi:hypothetical protein
MSMDNQTHAIIPCTEIQTYRPVEVEMAELVGEPLVNVWPDAHTIIDDIVVSGGDCALPNCLRHQEEVQSENDHVLADECVMY